jgi:Na+/H+ antiporter NhaD/arsenite permease-like protein
MAVHAPKRAATAVAVVAGAVTFMAIASPAAATEPLHGAHLPWPLALPFAGILLSIAYGPLVVKEWWHIHYEKAAVFWATLTIAGLTYIEGPAATAAAFAHSMALEYLPFILMLFALFTTAGGILICGRLAGSPVLNCAILAFGAALASLIGTTGASMILIRPLIRANESRGFNAHVVVFFIFLVSNIGGGLTPLCNPPIFLGFLRGIDFFWTTRVLWPQTFFVVSVLLALFFLIDFYFHSRENGYPLCDFGKSLEDPTAAASAQGGRLRVSGTINIWLIAVAISAIIVSGIWRRGIHFDLFGARIELQNLVREVVMIGVGLASLALTSARVRAALRPQRVLAAASLRPAVRGRGRCWPCVSRSRTIRNAGCGGTGTAGRGAGSGG